MTIMVDYEKGPVVIVIVW